MNLKSEVTFTWDQGLHQGGVSWTICTEHGIQGRRLFEECGQNVHWIDHFLQYSPYFPVNQQNSN